MTTNTESNEKSKIYADEPLKVGDKVGVRYHTDIKPGTVIKATATRATVRLHSFKCVNLPNSGAPDAMKFHVGGFCGHMEGQQRNEVDETSNDGEVTITFRKKDKVNCAKNGVWRQAGYTGGLGKLGGVIYRGLISYYDFNF